MHHEIKITTPPLFHGDTSTVEQRDISRTQSDPSINYASFMMTGQRTTNQINLHSQTYLCIMRKYFAIYGFKVLKLNTESNINTWRDGRLSKSKSVKYDDAEPNAQIPRINFSVYSSGASFISIQFLNYSLANNLKEKLQGLNLEYLDTGKQIEKVIIRFSKDSHQKIRDMLTITANEYPTFKAIHAEFEGQIFSILKIDESQSIIASSNKSTATTMTY